MREDFGKGTVCVGLDNPKIGPRGPHETKGIVQRTTVNAHHRHHDAKQKAQPDTGQKEAEKVVPDVPVGEVHCPDCSPTAAARPTRSPVGRVASTLAPSGMPPRISIRPSSMRCPNVTSRRTSRPFSTVHTVPRPLLNLLLRPPG